MKPNGPSHFLINTFIETAKSELNKHYLFLMASGQMVLPNQLKNLYLGIEEKPQYKTICEAFDYHNIKMAETIKVNKVASKTLVRYEITKNKVIDFMQKVYKVNDKPLPELRLAFVSEFEHFLLTKHKLQNNTAHKYIKNLKKIMNMAVGLDWIPSNPFTFLGPGK